MKVFVVSGKLTKATAKSVGYDLYAESDQLLLPNSSNLIKTGLRLKMQGCWGKIYDRSGLAAKFRVTTRAGVIDEDYEGEVGVVLVNENPNEAYQIKAGDRVAQIVFYPMIPVEVVGAEVKDAVRAEGGFGSSGK